MKTYFFIILVILLTAVQSIAATSINKITQWPYTSTMPYIQPSPNSVVTGDHDSYPAGIVIWAIGDTVLVRNADGLAEIATFQVSVAKSIKDMCYVKKDGVATLYLALGLNGLQIFNLSVLSSPELIGTYAVSTTEPTDDPGYQINITTNESEETYDIDATGIGYYDNHIFLTDNNFGLRVIDVTDVENLFETPLDDPVEITLDSTWVFNPSIQMYEEIERSITRNSGYIQANVNRSYDTTGGYLNIEVLSYTYPGPLVGERVYACVHDYYYGIRIFDITNPGLIEPPVSRPLTTDNWFLYNALINDICLSSGSDYDTSTPEDRLYAYVTAADSVGTSVVARLDILSEDGVVEYIGTDADGAAISSITNIGRCETPGTAVGVFAKDDHVYVADFKVDVINNSDPDVEKSGLQIIDISTGEPINDSTPVLNYSPVASYVTDVPIALSLAGDDGNNIYLHDALNGLHKIQIDITSHDTVSTSLAGAIASPLSGDSVYVEGNFAYCLDSDDGLRIFDISAPTSLILQSFYETTGNDVVVSGNFAYIAKGNAGIEIIDVSTKTAPVLNSIVNTAGDAVALDLYQSGSTLYACVADSSAGLSIINLSANPVTQEVVGAAGAVNDVVILGDDAYLATNSGLSIVNLSADPIAVSDSKSTTGNGIAVSAFTTVRGGVTKVYALISDSTGIMIEDVTDPSNIPAETIATIETTATADTSIPQPFESIEIVEDYLFASAGLNGAFLYDISNPSSPSKIDSSDPIFPSKEVFPFTVDNNYYFASAEESNMIAVYRLNFGSSLAPALTNGGDSLSCFISSVSE